MALSVNEVFYSIQGESSFAGLPCVFIRLAGCNLRCSYCDTRYAYNAGEQLDIAEIIGRIASYGCPLVELTGGEPLIQQETPTLIFRLLEAGYQVLLETNGSQDISRVDKRCFRIMDIKCPSSGEEDKNDPENIRRLTARDEVKFVIGDREDYEYGKKRLGLITLNSNKKNVVHFSPLFGKMPPDTLAKWILEDHLDVRLHLQLHKVIWPFKERGL